MDKVSILLVDDEVKIILVLKAYLEKEGFKVFTAKDGKEALDKARGEKIDLIILDLMLPSLSGEEVCRRLRRDSNIPIIMLTAKVQPEDRIEGLGLGADDYIIKPFSPQEVLARVKAVLRRVKNNKGERMADILHFSDGELVIDNLRHQVKYKDELLSLTPTEYKILSTMARTPGRVYSRDQITELVHGYNYTGFDRTIDAHIKNLRQKLDSNEDGPKFIHTVYGLGYRFEHIED